MKVSILLMLISSTLFAQFNEKEHFYLIGDDTFVFSENKEKDFLISAHCTKEDSACEALEIFNNPPKINFYKGELKGGKNPGSVICKKYNAKVIIAKDLIDNQQSFCKFKDESMLSTGVLSTLY